MLYPWQQEDWRRINTERERLPNAWLFTGAAGIGKLAFAEHLARSLLCDRPDAALNPCGECEACRWLANAGHPDFRRLTPAGEDADEKSARRLPLIRIEAVREMIDFAHLTAHRNGRRVILVEPAEALNPAAANALLKILEEPPRDVLFLLVAHAPQRLLPTIRSRCRPFQLSAPTHEQALGWLREQGVADAENELAYHGGAPLFDHDPALAAVRRQFLDGLELTTFASALQLAEMIDKHKLSLGQALEWLQQWLLDLAGAGLAGSVRYFPDRRSRLDALAGRADMVELMRCQQEVVRLAPYGQHTLNVRLQLEALLMGYLKIFASARPA
jgi:DNA polymerase-3 subunit delta'